MNISPFLKSNFPICSQISFKHVCNIKAFLGFESISFSVTLVNIINGLFELQNVSTSIYYVSQLVGAFNLKQ